MKSGPRRVVITGTGAVTPLANNVRATWAALLEGRSGIGPITLFDASTFPTRIAGEVKGLDLARWRKTRPEGDRLGRNSIFALEAVAEAMAQAGLSSMSGAAAERMGIYFGAGDGGFDFVRYAGILKAAMTDEVSVNVPVYLQKTLKYMDPQALLEQEPSQVVDHLAEQTGARGPVSNCLTACAASSQAIGEAAEIIRRGEADIMISGGTHSMIHPLGVAGFNLLTALSTRNDDPQGASRPFDKERDGFVLSEGAGVVVLEELEHARKRGATILGELAGYGCTADAFRLTDPRPDGGGAIRAMRNALSDAGLGPDRIDYINAHGTSTELNDQVETAAIKEVFGAAASRLPVSSIKSMLGHMIAAAGAVELIISALTIRDGILPPTINYRTPDPVCDLDYVPNTARRKQVSVVLSNSFGFGGQNIALVVRRYEG